VLVQQLQKQLVLLNKSHPLWVTSSVNQAKRGSDCWGYTRPLACPRHVLVRIKNTDSLEKQMSDSKDTVYQTFNVLRIIATTNSTRIQWDRHWMYTRNTQARSRNHCCRRKAIRITYSEFVSVASVIQHAERMRRVILSSLAVLHYAILRFHNIS